MRFYRFIILFYMLNEIICKTGLPQLGLSIGIQRTQDIFTGFKNIGADFIPPIFMAGIIILKSM